MIRPTNDDTQAGARGLGRFVVGILLLAALTLAGPTAWAYWTSSGDGTGSATTSTLNAPTLVMAAATPGLNEVGLTWTAPTGLVPTGYYATRTRLSDGSTAPACASSPSSPVAGPCTDSPVPAGTYRYTVTAVYRSWTATSAFSDFVTVLPDATAPVVTVTSVNGSPRVFPYRTNAPVTTIGGACGTVPGDTAWVTPVVGGVPGAPVPCTSGSWIHTLGVPVSSGTVTLSATQGDQTGNLGTAPEQAVVIDMTPPTVVSILRAGASPIVNAGPLSWDVMFSEPVSGVLASNFTLVTGGLSGGPPLLSAVTAVGGAPSATWTVTASLNGATGSAGSIGLDLTSSGSIADAATNTLGTTSFSGQAYALDTAQPTVIGVSSTAFDGRYGVGTVIPVTVTFSEPVTVTGTPRLTLATGSPAAAVGYTSGSGSSTLTFAYTVAAGHASNDLDYVSTASLALNGGTIVDAVGNAAVLTLSAPGAPGSLGATKALVIDTIPPTVSGVSAALANGRYGVGLVVPVTVTFSEAVTVIGTPQLSLATGTPAATAVAYTSGSGTATLTFEYTVSAGNSSSDLDYSATTALTLNGGSIADAAGNPATLTLAGPGTGGSLGAAKALIIDTIAPVVTVTQVGGTARTFPYLTTADVTSIGGTCGIATGDLAPVTVLVNGSPVGTVNCTAGGAWTSPVSWTTDGTRLVSATQSDTATNIGTALERAVIVDKLAPTVVGVSSTAPDGSYRQGQVVPVTVTFSEPVNVTGTPTLTLRTRPTNPTTTTVNYTAGTGTTTLTFAYTVAAGHTSADLDYAATTSLALNGGLIRDAAARDANRTLATPGAPDSLGAARNIVIDTTAPTVSSVSATLPNGRYGIGQVIPVTVTFTEVMTVTGTPRLTLATGAPAATAVGYTSGSGTTTLTFEYTIVAGNSSADLNYQATTSLALNGGTITDAAGNAATLTLPGLAAATSLGGGKNLVIDTVLPTVTGVSSSLASGSYRAGQVVPVTVTFSEAVTVTGTPQLTLATGSPASTPIDYTSGSGTTVLTFTYTVVAGNTAADLDYASTPALALNGGTIKDLAGNGAALALAAPGTGGSLGAARNLVIDTTAPVVTVTRVNGVVRTFPWSTGAIVTSIGGTCGTAAGDAATVAPLINGAATTPATATCGSGSWTLTLGTALSTSGTRALSATQGDLAGNIGTAPDQTLVVDRTPPTVTSIVRLGASQSVNSGPLSWTVTFSEPVSGVATSNFGLATSGISGTPVLSGVAPVGLVPSATWTVSAAVGGVTGTNSGSIGLNLTGSGSVVDGVGNALTTTALTGPAYSYDTARPTVTGVSSTLADGSYGAGQVVPVTVTFSEPVTVSGTPQLTMATGPSATTAVGHTSGSGGTTLTFEYTVADGDTSADLDYAATSSLALNGGGITDAAGNPGILTLAGPGAPGSLGAGKALVIDTTPPDVTVSAIEPLTLWIFRLLRVSGTAEVGAGPVTVFLCATTQPVCDATTATQTFTNVAVDNDGTWLTGWSLQGQGTWYARATQTDAAGNVGTSSLAGPVDN